MANFEITGRTKLNGTLHVSGAKNEVLKLIPLSVLIEGDFEIKNAPNISDVASQIEIFKALGGKSEREGSILKLNSQYLENKALPINLSSKLRASIVFAGPLLSRFKTASIPCPGGCVIGDRSIETHLDAFRQAGVSVQKQEDAYILNTEKESGEFEITLREKSVTATENIILYLCKGILEAKISNYASEPEIIHLIETINSAGGKISVINENEIFIKGVQSLKLEEATAIPDRIEAGTFVIAFVATGGEGVVSPYPSRYLEAFTQKLTRCGVNIKIQNNDAIITRSDDIRPFNIITAPYPGFPTDLQSPMSLIACLADGVSHINESMFNNRLGYLRELEAMGAAISIINNNEADIKGPAYLRPGIIESLDLRSGITLLLAAMMCDGKSILKNAEIIDRGYENIEEKLNSAGANIIRKDDVE